MQETKTILKVLNEKIEQQEATIYCKDLEIKMLKEELEALKKEEAQVNE